MPSTPLPRTDLLNLRGKKLMCSQITDKDFAVQKLLSDHGVLSLLFLTFPNHRESGTGPSESKSHLFTNASTSGRASVLILPEKLYGLLAARAEVVQLVRSVQ